LRDVQALGCAAEMHLFCDRYEVPHVPNFQNQPSRTVIVHAYQYRFR
jgi:hypothetical protein